MTVSVVIPAWNDPEGVQAALDALAGVDCVSEVVVVDDCSQIPVSETINTEALTASGTSLQVLRHEENKGGGGARNTGLEAVQQPYVIFLDSDDLPTQNYNSILEAFIASSEPFDFGMFRHIDSRELALGREAGVPVDEQYWDRLPKSDAPQQMTRQQMCEMAAVSAYPWNKLYRTAFLKENNIRCTEIPVHNDIELHWESFVRADRILYSHQTGLMHFVMDVGNRITNRKGIERLRVFEALEHICHFIRQQDVPMPMQVAYWNFVNKLLRWIPGNLEPDLLSGFQAARGTFILQNLPKPTFNRIAMTDPGLSNSLLGLLRERP